MTRARIAGLATAIVLIAIAIAAWRLAAQWPFTPERMADSLGDTLNARLAFGKFEQVHFPEPGFVARQVEILPNQGSEAGRADVDTLRVEATWTGLLHHHIARMTADGLAIRVRSLHDRVFVGNAGPNTIDELDIRRADLQLDGRRFEFHRAVLHHVGRGREIDYEVAAAIPQPTGELKLSGAMGPFHHLGFAHTPFRGSYTLTGADLGVFPGIAGNLSSQGNFSGVISRLEFRGRTDIPDFEVTESGHRHHFVTEFHALVNAMNGDTAVPELQARIDRTSFSANASVTGKTAKTATLEVVSGRGTIQDLLLLFIKGRESPIVGPIGFRAHIVLPPGERPFKQRVALTGDFGISNAGFTKPATQAKADELSERAEGEPGDPPERVLSDLAGHVILRDGLAHFASLSFRVPGANANLSGTYNLVTERIDLRGQLVTEVKLSKTTTGIKSVFLKLLDPLFKRKPSGAVIPVSVDGTYDQPRFHEVFTK